MRFSELQLLRYGRFEDCRLAFPDQPTDLHVIFGPNEAGKSTTMSAVGDLLFGFPHISPYDFRFDNKLLRVGAVIEGEGGQLVCVRKKGRSGTLSGPDERTIEEGALVSQLAGYSAEGFQRMFSLDHGRLREGGRAILAASDDVGQAIFAAGSGLIGVTSVLATLEEEAKAIWTKRAGDRRYYLALRAYDDARALQKAAQIKPAAWDELNKEIGRLDDEIADLDKLRDQAIRDREKVERRRRVLPHAALYRSAQAALAELGDVSEFSADASVVLDEVTTVIAEARVEARLAEEDIVRLREALAPIVVDQRLIDRSAEIGTLRETKGAVDKSLSDLARKRLQVRTLVADLTSHQRELGWPSEHAAQAKERLPQRVSVAEVRDLLVARSALDATLKAAVEEETTASEALGIVQDELAPLPPDADDGELALALRFARGLGDIEAVVGTAQRDVDQRLKVFSIDVAKLMPWTGDVEALRRLTLPSEPQTTLAVTMSASAESGLAEARREHQAAVKRGEQLALSRDQLTRDDHAVSPHAVEAARTSRDQLWVQVRAHLLEEAVLPDPLAAADGFEERTSVADTTADQKFAYAEQSAKLAGLQDDIERHELATQQSAETVRAAEAAVKTCSDGWQALLSASGLDLTPSVFVAWSERRRRALESAETLDDAREVLLNAQARLEAGRARLLAGLQAVAVQPDGELSFGRLLERADQLETLRLAQAAERSRLKDALATAERSLKRSADKVANAQAAIAPWDKDWARATKAAALSDGVSPAVVRAQLDLIDTIRSMIDDILDLEQRIRDMDQDAAAFSEAVMEMATTFRLETLNRSPGDLVGDLAKALGAATTAQTELSGLMTQLAKAEQRLAEAGSDEIKAVARLEPLAEVVGSADRDTLTAAVKVSERARAVRADLARHAEEIVRAGEDSTLETLLADCEGSEIEELALRSQRLTDEVTRLSSEVAQLSAERATAKAEFKRLDAGPDAVIAAADAEQAKAEMALQAEAYVRKRAEVVLLKWAIAKYRAEKQSPLLKRASAIFSRLTLGRYAELLVDLESEKARLAGLTADQSVVPVEGMSQGTVDQLFLSLRLAAVEEAVENGARLPFLADDLFINYDDARSVAGFQVLAELARKTQVLFFTHHEHLVGLARQALSPVDVPSLTLS